MTDTRRPARPMASVAEPVIRTAGPEDAGLLSRFLTGLSTESAYSRFLTGMGGPPPARLLAALLPARPAGGALLGFVDGRLAGHGLWVRLADPRVAEVAIVVADGVQRRGIGTALARALTDDLVRHGVDDIEVMSLSGNRAVSRMVARAAPDARRELDGPTSTYRFPARAPAALLSRTA